jgi:membrane protein CcdC involved in cytochrome C biogenesis
MSDDGARALTYGITGIAMVIVMAFRWRRMKRSTPLKLERLWIIPALYSAFAAAMFWFLPPHGWQWSWSAGALLLGGAVGWLRGKAMRIEIDPVTHDLNQRQSPAALLIIAGLVVIRIFARSAFGMDIDPTHVSHGLVGAFIAFAVGLLSLQRLEMYLRARRLLEEAQASRGMAAAQ